MAALTPVLREAVFCLGTFGVLRFGFRVSAL